MAVVVVVVVGLTGAAREGILSRDAEAVGEVEEAEEAELVAEEAEVEEEEVVAAVVFAAVFCAAPKCAL